MGFDGGDVRDFDAVDKRIIDAVATSRTLYSIWVGFFGSVCTDNTNILCFLVLEGLGKHNEYNGVCSCFHVLVANDKLSKFVSHDMLL